MDNVSQLIIYGVFDAGNIGTVAVALSLLYSSTKILNFSLPLSFSAGGYAVYELYAIAGQSILVSLVAACLLCFFTGLLV